MKHNNMLAMILAGGRGSRLHELTNKVAKPAVSYGGKYRIVDFPLSNCANSGIDVVGVLTQYESILLNSYVAADQWTWHNERYPGAFAERFHFRNDQYHEFDAGSCRNCIRYGACDDHAERCISGRLYFKSQYTNPADILYDCLYWICILV